MTPDGAAGEARGATGPDGSGEAESFHTLLKDFGRPAAVGGAARIPSTRR